VSTAPDRALVWLFPPTGAAPLVCGELRRIGGGRKLAFRYDAAWLAQPDAFALAPDLPLKAGEIEPAAHLDVHPVFEDAGPDDWGRRVIDRAYQPSRRLLLDYLALAGQCPVGALGFTWPDQPLQTDTLAGLESIEELLAAVHSVENREPLSQRHARLLKPGTSVGGMRPKALIAIDGQPWMAKFPSRLDEQDVCGIEGASLTLARECGIDVAASRLVTCAKRQVLLVKRFDRDGEARRQFFSARTMFESEGLNYSYAHLAQLVRKHSAQPVADAHELFRRLLFNIVIENGDDHERNHGFLRNGHVYRLAPAYDIAPQLQNTGYQAMAISGDEMASALPHALATAHEFGLGTDAAREIAVGVVGTVAARWRAVFLAAGVPTQDIELAARFVEPRLVAASAALRA